jgi:hypothetical protein
MYTHSRGEVQTGSGGSGGTTRDFAKEWLELDVLSRYNRMSESARYRRQDDRSVGPMYLTFSNIR